MFLEFTVANFLSFKEKKTLSLDAAPIKEHPENIFKTARYKLLKSAIIYGANASGKSNLLKAMSTMRWLVLQSFDQASTNELDITPFLLSTLTEGKPSFFEVLFLLNDIRYRYGFEVTNKTVSAEWLFESKSKTEKPLFIRQNDGIEVFPAFKEGKDLEEKTRENALFLAVVDKFNGPIAKSIIQWFTNFVTISGLSHEDYKHITFQMMKRETTSNQLLNFYKDLDLGFEDIKANKIPFSPKELDPKIPESVVKQLITDLEGAFRIDVKTKHKKFNENEKEVEMVEFDLRSQESAGTNKTFNISGPVFDVLSSGGVLVIDELDSSLHPLITLAITKLFNSKEFNTKNAQLIFSTHDTNLMNYGAYRRDQIYFVEKNRFGASDIYSLVEYKKDGKKVRNDNLYEKDYIRGRYGAIPFIGNISNLIK